jgi:hypothetical protein
MTIVNTNGLVFFGTGSEWLWSMLQFLVVAVSLGAAEHPSSRGIAQA